MLIVMHGQSTEQERQQVVNRIEELGLRAHIIPGPTRSAIGITGNTGPIDENLFNDLAGVVQSIRVTKPYKLVSREMQPADTVIDLGDGVIIGGNELTIIAGPCSVESEEQMQTIASELTAMGVRLLRGGAYKPRTSPYAFQGMGVDGINVLSRIKRQFGMKTVTEVIDTETLPLLAEHADILQIGARNMYNYSLLKKVGQCGKPVLLKRGLSATLEEFLMAAEYILSHGNSQVILCERGIRTFNDYSRNTLDINIIPKAREISHLPIIVDPSHASGDRRSVLPLARAAIAAGAQGLIIEVHHRPDKAFSDGAQSIYPMQLKELIKQVRQIHDLIV